MPTNDTIFEHPNKVLGEALSPATVDLMNKLKEDTGFSVRFERFEANEKYHSCKHFASGDIVGGVPTVYLNCPKVFGYVNLIVSHEFLHIYLSIEGYPTPKYETDNERAEEVASLVKSILEHPIIQQRQIEMDHSDKEFQDAQVEKLLSSPPDGGDRVLSALRYVEYKLMCKNEELLKVVDSMYSNNNNGAIDAKQLGMELLRRYNKYGGSVKGKEAALKILEEWIEILKGYGINLMVA